MAVAFAVLVAITLPLDIRPGGPILLGSSELSLSWMDALRLGAVPIACLGFRDLEWRKVGLVATLALAALGVDVAWSLTHAGAAQATEAGAVTRAVAGIAAGVVIGSTVGSTGWLIIDSLALGAASTSILGVAERLLGRQLVAPFLYPDVAPVVLGRSSGLTVHPNVQGAFLASMLGGLLMWGCIAGARRRLVLGVTTVLVLAGIAVTDSRGAWLASAMVIVCAVVLWVRGGRRRSLVAGPAAAAVILLGVLNGRLLSTAEFATRARAWRVALREAVSAPVFGLGPGTYPLHFRAYYGAAGVIPHAHNLWLDLASQEGLVGVTVVGLLLVVALRAAPAAWARAEPSMEVAWSLVLIAFLVDGMVDDPAFISSGYLALVVAAGVHLYHQAGAPDPTQPGEPGVGAMELVKRARHSFPPAVVMPDNGRPTGAEARDHAPAVAQDSLVLVAAIDEGEVDSPIELGKVDGG